MIVLDPFNFELMFWATAGWPPDVCHDDLDNPLILWGPLYCLGYVEDPSDLDYEKMKTSE